jgi:hypothetical protein
VLHAVCISLYYSLSFLSTRKEYRRALPGTNNRHNRHQPVPLRRTSWWLIPLFVMSATSWCPQCGLIRATLAAAGLLLLVAVLSPTVQAAKAAPAAEERLIGMYVDDDLHIADSETYCLRATDTPNTGTLATPWGGPPPTPAAPSIEGVPRLTFHTTTGCNSVQPHRKKFNASPVDSQRRC